MLYNVSIEQDIPIKMKVEAFEAFSYYTLKGSTPVGFEVVLIDIDRKLYKTKIRINLLKRNESKNSDGKTFNYRYDFYKEALKRQKEAHLERNIVND